jgi:hypothetical protein
VEDETLCQLVKSLTYEIYQSAMDSLQWLFLKRLVLRISSP